MKTSDIIQELQERIDNIKYDLAQEWNNTKVTHTVQLVKLETCLSLLSTLGENDNFN